ncbi:MAG: rod shape-determining protein MreC [Negativicutes bacterium]
MQQRKKKFDYKIWLLIVAAVILILSLFSYVKTQNGSVGFFDQAAATIAYPFERSAQFFINETRGVKNYISDIYSVYDNNKVLKQENSELKNRLIGQTETENENIRLRKLMELKKAYGYTKSKTGNVIGFDIQAYSKSMTIDLGSSDGVTINMPVIVKEGVVGAISEVYAYSSRIRLVVSPDISFSATVQRFDARTFALGQGVVGIENYIQLDNIPQNIDIVKGDRVVTRGLGGVFPKGLLIGEVVEVSDASGYLHSAKVKPAVNVYALEQVLVLTDYKAPQIN